MPAWSGAIPTTGRPGVGTSTAGDQRQPVPIRRLLRRLWTLLPIPPANQAGGRLVDDLVTLPPEERAARVRAFYGAVAGDAATTDASWTRDPPPGRGRWGRGNG
jgi:hypothetical protein